MTLKECAASAEHSLSFREKIEIAKLMDKLHCDIIEMPEIMNPSTDILLIKTVASLISHSALCVNVGGEVSSAETAWNCVKGAKKPAILKVSVPVSAVQMEFKFGKKPPVVLKTAEELVAECRKYSEDVEFSAEDAVRGDRAFLCDIIRAAINAGANKINICDSEGLLLPSETADFIKELYESVPELKNVSLSVEASDRLSMATAAAFSAVAAGADEIKIVADGFDLPKLENVMKVFAVKGDSAGIQSKIRTTELQRVTAQMKRLLNTMKSETSPFENGVNNTESLTLDKNDSISTVIAAIKKIGYDLSEEDNANVFAAFRRVAEKKDFVGTKELEAIIASSALQVPSTYTIESYVINSGNIITATANIKLIKDGKALTGVSVGDGPVDAAFLAIEQITGHHYELDDFQIRAVTEGREAMGSSLVKLRSASGKLYSGTGISTDVIGASIRAYVSALNKIAYEEE